MNNFSLRLKKNNDKAITPVIATIILIAVTLVLALVVGAYTFGLFGSNVKTITVTSDTLYAAGTFQFALNNPGAQTLITQVVLTSGNGGSISLTSTSIDIGATGDATVSGGAVSSVIVTVPTTGPNNWSGLLSGQTYSFVITFQNGQSITGSAIAQ